MFFDSCTYLSYAFFLVFPNAGAERLCFFYIQQCRVAKSHLVEDRSFFEVNVCQTVAFFAVVGMSGGMVEVVECQPVGPVFRIQQCDTVVSRELQRVFRYVEKMLFCCFQLVHRIAGVVFPEQQCCTVEPHPCDSIVGGRVGRQSPLVA